MRKFTILILATISFTLFGCASTKPWHYKNPETGEVRVCKRTSGDFSNCHDSLYYAGWEGMSFAEGAKYDSDLAAENARQERDERNEGERENNSAKLCWENIMNDPFLKVISDKITLDINSDPTMAMLTNKNIPNPKEKEAILIFGEANKKCNDLATKINEKRGFYESSAVSNAKKAEINALVALYEGKLTYADFAKYINELKENTRIASQKIADAIAQKAADSEARAQEIANQQALVEIQALTALSQANATNRVVNGLMFNSINTQPQKTYPNPSVNCISNQMGAFTTTNCN